MQLRRHQAGRSAHRRYIELRRDWQQRAAVRKVRLTFLLLFVGTFALAASPAALTFRLFGAATAGVFATLWVVVGDMSPRADRYERGAGGERKTENVTRPLLREGWVIRHDLDSAYGNIDHVAIGPSGIFLLDTKTLAGQVAVDESAAVIVQPPDDRPRRWDKIDGQARGAAAGLHRTLAAQLGRTNFRVKPVVVIWAPFEARVVEAKGVVFVHGDELANWLRSQRPKYTPAEIQAFGVVLNEVPTFMERSQAS